MNILFLSLGRYWSINESEGYTDLLREFIRHGDKVYILSPTERHEGKKTQLVIEDNSVILKVKTGNIQKTNFIEKGISTVMIESQFLNAIRRFFSNVKFDLVLYPTPPITFVRVVEYVKKRDAARSYLLLKDIFPQNAVDIGIMSKQGLKGILYKYFRAKEKRLYSVSDAIGCMSPANVQYILKHNPWIDCDKLEVCPNVIEIPDKAFDENTRAAIRFKYGIPVEKKIFVYGGNLGKPQGIDFLIKCLESQKDNGLAFFLIVGDGMDFEKLEEYSNQFPQSNFKLMKRLPKEEFDMIVASCDVGMIFLDHRFTIPNFPSRLLSYMQARIPVLACTDTNSDIGKVITEGGFGWWCESNNVEGFGKVVEVALKADTKMLGNIAYINLLAKYSVETGYRIIQERLKKNG